jgi:hypothetical protein
MVGTDISFWLIWQIVAAIFHTYRILGKVEKR